MPRIKRSLKFRNVYNPNAPEEIVTIESSARIYGELEKAIMEIMYRKFGMQVKQFRRESEGRREKWRKRAKPENIG